MALADGGELIVLAPALREFGEDREIDRLIRKYGYFGTPATLKATAENEELKNNLSAAAHLIHGSSEGRFSITYCPGSKRKTSPARKSKAWASTGPIMTKWSPAITPKCSGMALTPFPTARRFTTSPTRPSDYGPSATALTFNHFG